MGVVIRCRKSNDLGSATSGQNFKLLIETLSREKGFHFLLINSKAQQYLHRTPLTTKSLLASSKDKTIDQSRLQS